MSQDVRRRGFTLVEMMVVIVILGILATLVIHSVGDKGEKARAVVTAAQVREIAGKVAMFKLDHNRYPEKLDDLVFRPPYVAPEEWHPYAEEPPRDRWGREFVYTVPGTDGFPFDLVSYGADGRPGGGGFDQDLWNHARAK